MCICFYPNLFHFPPIAITMSTRLAFICRVEPANFVIIIKLTRSTQPGTYNSSTDPYGHQL